MIYRSNSTGAAAAAPRPLVLPPPPLPVNESQAQSVSVSSSGSSTDSGGSSGALGLAGCGGIGEAASLAGEGSSMSELGSQQLQVKILLPLNRVQGDHGGRVPWLGLLMFVILFHHLTHSTSLFCYLPICLGYARQAVK